MDKFTIKLGQKLKGRKSKKSNWFSGLIVMTDQKRLPDPSFLIPQLPSGSILILRAFSKKEKMDLIHKNKQLCQKYKVRLLVSDDLKLALKHRLDGVHFPEETHRRLSSNGFLKFKKQKDFLISAACHGELAVRSAHKIGANFALLSPVFETPSHKGQKSLGSFQVRKLVNKHPLNFIALGGVQKRKTNALQNFGFKGAAGISLFL